MEKPFELCFKTELDRNGKLLGRYATWQEAEADVPRMIKAAKDSLKRLHAMHGDREGIYKIWRRFYPESYVYLTEEQIRYKQMVQYYDIERKARGEGFYIKMDVNRFREEDKE